MSSEDLVLLNVWLAGRSYRIKVKPEEEAAVRRAVKLADERVMEMRNQYAGKDDQDFLAMCLLTYAADIATEASFDPAMKQDLADMSKRIDAVLSKS